MREIGNFVDIRNARLIALAEQSNDIYMEADMVFLTEEENLNGIKYTRDFINNIVEQKEKYMGIPLVVDIDKLLEKDFFNLTHLFKDNKFKTTSIGSFIDFYSRESNHILELCAKVRIWKRNPEVCGAIVELYASDAGLQFSYEVMVSGYTLKDNIKIIDKNQADLIGSCVVSFPAVPAAKCEILVAELINYKKGEIMEKPTVDEFTKDVKYHCEIAELSHNQIEIKLRNLIYEKTERWYYQLNDIFSDFIIIFDYENGDYFKVTYMIEDDNIQLTSDFVKVTKEYIEAQIVETNKDENKGLSIAELNAKILNLKHDLQNKDIKIAELNRKIITMGEELTNTKVEIEELQPYKAEAEKMQAEKEKKEKEEAKCKLREKASKVLSEKEMAELKDAIENLDEVKINTLIAEKYIAMAEKSKEKRTDKELFTASRVNDALIVDGTDIVNKYITRK